MNPATLTGRPPEASSEMGSLGTAAILKQALTAAALGLLTCCAGDPPEPRRVAPPPPIEDPNSIPDPPKYYRPPPAKHALEIGEPVVYLDPDEFPEAPEELRQALRSLGCRIPQVESWSLPEGYEPQPPHNLVSGNFKGLASLDWAVLCSRSGESALLLFDSAGNLMEELEPAREDGDRGFDWYVDAVDPQHIREDHESFGGPKPPPLMHDGIESGIAEKASRILYWQECGWISLQGGD